jgi:hypothetical protein
MSTGGRRWNGWWTDLEEAIFSRKVESPLSRLLAVAQVGGDQVASLGEG